MSYGFVYLLANHGMPGLYKVGMTERSPHLRAEQLSTTGVPHPFEVLCYIETSLMARVEREMHDAMLDFRVSSRREFFRFNRDHLPWVKGLFENHPERLTYCDCGLTPHMGPGLPDVNPWAFEWDTPAPCPIAPEAK